jgi:hypothetical protein
MASFRRFIVGDWHETITARIGVRAAGALLLILVWGASHWLAHLIHAGAPHDATPAEFLTGALLFTSATAGSALLTCGSGLWKKTPVAERWVQRDPRSRN